MYAQTRHGTSPHNLADLRWSFYSNKQSQADKTPPTLSALRPAIRRCHYQCMEWDRDTDPHPKLPPACDYGWRFENGRYEPIMCEIKCAPEEVLHLIRCSCKKVAVFHHANVLLKTHDYPAQRCVNVEGIQNAVTIQSQSRTRLTTTMPPKMTVTQTTFDGAPFLFWLYNTYNKKTYYLYYLSLTKLF